jgi:hypothetical protein
MLKKFTFLHKLRNIKSLADFKDKFNRKIYFFRRNLSFVAHEWIVSLFYGEDIEPPFIFHISPEDVGQIINILDSSKQLKFLDQTEKTRRGVPDWLLKDNEERYDAVNLNQTWFEIKKNITYDNLLKKMEPFLRNFLKSPFVIVSVSAWKTKPNEQVLYDSNGNVCGPNKLHTDSYAPGHLKCMVYLKPLNEAYGMVQIEEKTIQSEKPGCAVIFDQNKPHRCIPGKTEDRYCFEITVMRTLVETDMLKHYPCAPSSIHLLQSYQAYI